MLHWAGNSSHDMMNYVIVWLIKDQLQGGGVVLADRGGHWTAVGTASQPGEVPENGLCMLGLAVPPQHPCSSHQPHVSCPCGRSQSHRLVTQHKGPACCSILPSTRATAVLCGTLANIVETSPGLPVQGCQCMAATVPSDRCTMPRPRRCEQPALI